MLANRGDARLLSHHVGETLCRREVLMDTFNEQAVSVGGDDILVLMPKQRMTREQALRHAAWLVALAEPGSGLAFTDILEAVKNT